MGDEGRRKSLLPPIRRFSLQDGHGAEAGADLDEEMEKVFAMASDEKFDVSKLATSPDSTTSKRSIGERDYAMHRKKSYPHMHMPLKSIHSRSMRKKVGSPPSESDGAETSGAEGHRSTRKLSQAETESDSAFSPPILSPSLQEDMPTSAVMSGSTSPEEKEDPVLLSSESEPQVSERAASYSDSPTYGSPSEAQRHVQFQIGEIAEKPEGGEDETADKEQRDSGQDETTSLKEPEKKVKRKHSRHHHYHHHHRSRKYSLQEDPQRRLRSGSEFGIEEPREYVAKTEEGAELQELDLDDLTSHRFDDARGLRRYKQNKASSGSVIHIGRKDGTETLQSVLPLALKKMIDHSPHEVFVQLDELQGEGEEKEWKETARWIKYEEDVEEGADRWGRPHVASLSFHSLLNLRRCLETGVVLLDLEEKDLPGVSYRVVEQMVIEELICAENKATVMRALLLRHRHVNDHDRFRFGMKRTFSSYTSLQNLNDDKGKPKVVPSISSMDAAIAAMSTAKPGNNNTTSGDGEKSENHVVDVKEEMTYTSSNEDLKKAQKESILKRIPVGAEATTVLVGAVDFLEQPTIAFVRLAEGILMPQITEVTIPVRFLFILLGPTSTDLDYHEIGRSISTLMSNSQFHKIAYKATERRELLSAINEFLDDSIVLPPGDWERKALLPFRELKAKSEMIRKRKNTRLLEEDEAKKVLLATIGDGKGPPDDPLQRTRRPFGGLINDVKRRFPHYVSDFTDGCNLQCAAAAIFMYFAALSGAITFGGLMSDKTDNLIGIAETLISTSGAGIIFALFSGQPLIIVGTTGPLLLFDESLFSFCITNDIDFLAIRVYIGIWLGIIALIVVFFEGSVLVKLFTRFTEEIFAALISMLYIVESMMKLYLVFRTHPLLADYGGELCSNVFSIMSGNYSGAINESNILDVPDSIMEGNESVVNSSHIRGQGELFISPEDEHNLTNQPNTALFCLILALGTFFIAYYLRQFRNSKFLGRNARRALGDFGVPIAIITMVTLDYLTPTVYTEKLRVPEGLSPSKPSERGWFVSPTSANFELWFAFAACAPAMLVYILLFMETHICELIIDKKDRKLKKGSGFHLDIVIICFLNVGMGFMGAPWVCAATVRSIAHVSAVTVMSRTHAPGEKPHIIDVKEQRLSSLIVAVFVGISVLMAPLLRLVPISVLFGVFLYMGVSSTNGIQFFERLQLIFMPVKHHPQASYVRKVHSMKMHLFTFIQLLCLAVLWVVKSTEAALAFPFFLLLMVPLRAQLRFLFTTSELKALDSEEADADEDEPDFYTEAPMPG